jgi:hypothetical protein
MPALVKNLLVALGVLAVAVIGILTSFSIVASGRHARRRAPPAPRRSDRQ